MMLKTGDTVTTIRPLKVAIMKDGATATMTLMPGTYEVTDCLVPERAVAIHKGFVSLFVTELDTVVDADYEDFEDACYNESDWERDNADILNHPDNPDNKDYLTDGFTF